MRRLGRGWRNGIVRGWIECVGGWIRNKRNTVSSG